MSERQVQYTDGSWSRDVEVTDDLLDEATRLHYEVICDDREAEWRRLTAEHDLVPALIERVRTAEGSRDAVTAMYHGSADRAETAEAERDAAREDCNKNATNVRRLTLELHEARGKLDKVRALAESKQRAKVGGGFLSGSLNTADVLAILDGKTGD